MKKFGWPTLVFRAPRRGSSRYAILAISLLLIFAALALTQDNDQPLVPSRTQPQRVTLAPVGPVSVRAGNSAQVQLDFRVAPGFHINSNKPNSDLLVPTVIKLNPPTDLAVAKVTYPPGHDLSFAFAPDEKLNVYTGDFSLGAMVRAARSMPPGRYRVQGDLKYQACDDKSCYPPTQVPVAFDVQIGKAASTRTRRDPAQSPHIHP